MRFRQTMKGTLTILPPSSTCKQLYPMNACQICIVNLLGRIYERRIRENDGLQTCRSATPGHLCGATAYRVHSLSLPGNRQGYQALQ
jgi:hypothetical protein